MIYTGVSAQVTADANVKIDTIFDSEVPAKKSSYDLYYSPKGKAYWYKKVHQMMNLVSEEKIREEYGGDFVTTAFGQIVNDKDLHLTYEIKTKIIKSVYTDDGDTTRESRLLSISIIKEDTLLEYYFFSENGCLIQYGFTSLNQEKIFDLENGNIYHADFYYDADRGPSRYHSSEIIKKARDEDYLYFLKRADRSMNRLMQVL